MAGFIITGAIAITSVVITVAVTIRDMRRERREHLTDIDREYAELCAGPLPDAVGN